MNQLKKIDLVQDFFVDIIKRIDQHSYFSKHASYKEIKEEQTGYEECLYSVFGAMIMSAYHDSPFCFTDLFGYGRISQEIDPVKDNKKYDFIMLSKYKDDVSDQGTKPEDEKIVSKLLTIVEFKGPTTWNFLLGGSVKKGSEEITDDNILSKYNSIFKEINSQKGRKNLIGSDSIWGDINKVYRKLELLKNKEIDLLGLCIGFVVTSTKDIDVSRYYSEMFDVFVKRYSKKSAFSIDKITGLQGVPLKINDYYLHKVGCAIKLR